MEGDKTTVPVALAWREDAPAKKAKSAWMPIIAAENGKKRLRRKGGAE